MWISMYNDWLSKILLMFLDCLTTQDCPGEDMQLLACLMDSLTRIFSLLAFTYTSTAA